MSISIKHTKKYIYVFSCMTVSDFDAFHIFMCVCGGYGDN